MYMYNVFLLLLRNQKNVFDLVTMFASVRVISSPCLRSNRHRLCSDNEIVDLHKYSTFHVFCRRLSASPLCRRWLRSELPVVSV